MLINRGDLYNNYYIIYRINYITIRITVVLYDNKYTLLYCKVSTHYVFVISYYNAYNAYHMYISFKAYNVRRTPKITDIL